ncbi:hypothetical protein [Psychrobacter sp. TB47]|uniref:hypothetical protein n=3 Tax=Psychrobacter TaxID=497 RepID=UPI00046F2813|nr:hypothetical protein [Psychrobacter sp. TB47]
MGVKKLITYGRYALALFLVIYLLLVWMYFKDNTLQLTSARLLLWFVIIPIILFGFIVFIKWRQKKSEAEELAPAQKISKKIKAPPIDSYQLFINSSICLPEGIDWPEIIDNDNDLTVLSEALSDFDGLPILTKPIEGVITEQTALYAYDNELDNEAYPEDAAESLNEQTLRLWALIDNQLTASDDALSVLAQHFERIMQQNIHEPNSALNIHPEWQQHYIASTTEDSSAEDSLPVISLSTLSIYLSIPELADANYLVERLKQQLATYGIPEQLLTIQTIIADKNPRHTDSFHNSHDGADNETYQPLQFIHGQLIALTKAATPEICLFITVDSQINEQWLEANLYVDNASNLLPTEAGILLIFYNKAAKDLLDLDHKVRFSMTEIGEALPNDASSMAAEVPQQAYSNTRQHYLANLKTIKQLLLDNSFALLDRHDDKTKAEEKKSAQAIDNKTTMTDALSENSITLLSDINPSTQPYDLSLLMTFIDEFIAQGALVNDHHLGHYMPLNSWLQPFLSLALLVSAAKEQPQESDIKLLITQHKHRCMLWLAESNQTL